MTGDHFPIHPDSLFGCNNLGHSWDDHGDCRHCPANIDDEYMKGTE